MVAETFHSFVFSHFSTSKSYRDFIKNIYIVCNLEDLTKVSSPWLASVITSVEDDFAESEQ